MKKISIIIFIVFSIFFCNQFIIAASIGVKPERIELSGAVGKALSQEVLIFNAGAVPGTYVLSVDDNIQSIAIEPKEFVLEAGAERLVRVATKQFFPKKINTNISVVSRPLDASGLSAAVGVKIPVTIKTDFSKIQIIILAFCLALMVMLLLKIMQFIKKKI